MFGTNGFAGSVGDAFNIDRGAILWLYSPRIFGTQVLRPYLYNFGGNMIDRLMGSAPTMRESIMKKDVVCSPEVAGAIRPEANGIPLNSNIIDTHWTFLLSIDLAPKYMSGDLSGVGSPSRLLCSGWCADIPVTAGFGGMDNPLINENCILNVTHHTYMNSLCAASNLGTIPITRIPNDGDLIDASLDQMAETADTYVMAPGDVLQNVAMEQIGGDRITTEGTNAVCNIKLQAAEIPSHLKSPIHHLKDIVYGVSSAIDTVNSEAFAARSFISGCETGASDDLDKIKCNASSNITKTVGQPNLCNAFDVFKPFSIGELSRQYPSLTVAPQRIAGTAQCDIIPQTEVSLKVAYSSMVSQAISAIAACSGLSNVIFAYKSFKSAMDLTGGSEGAFRVDQAYLLMPSSNQALVERQLQACLLQFKSSLETDLFPVLKAAQGDFELSAKYDVSSETIVDLHFSDYTYSTEGRGFYESSNRLPIYNNPMIGTSEQFISNGAELNKFINICSGKNITNALGTAAFSNVGSNGLFMPQSQPMAVGAPTPVGNEWNF